MMSYLEELADNVQVSHLEEEASQSSGNRGAGLVSVYSNRGRAADDSKRVRIQGPGRSFVAGKDPVLCAASTSMVHDVGSRCDEMKK